MSTLYFTSNASTGAGSLAEAIRNAQPGDVVRPDETVFERGSTIEIVLAATLTLDKNLTLDASPFRVVLNGDGAVACASVANGCVAAFTAFDFIGGVASSNGGSGGGLRVESGANVVLNRCRVCGCDAAKNGGGICVDDDAALAFNDGVIAGCRADVGGGLYLGATSRFTLSGSTVAANVDAASNGFSDVVAALGFDATANPPRNSIICAATSDGATLYNASTAAENGSVVGVPASEIGFVSPPAPSVSCESWSANALTSVDLHLLDDASPNPSPYRDAGDVGEMSQYDVQGCFRGRETNGATTCSPGAYETLQADLFWVGRDATGAEVVAPSFLTSDGWAASRFATVSGDAAPQTDMKLFVDGVVNFVDVLSTTTSKTFDLTLGGGAVAAFADAPTFYLGVLQTGLGAAFTFRSAQLRKPGFLGDWTSTNGTFNSFQAQYVGANVYIAAAYCYHAAPSAPTYGSLNAILGVGSGKRLSGAYRCDKFTARSDSGATVAPLGVSDGTTIRARTFTFGNANSSAAVERFFDLPPTLLPQGAATISFASTTPRESWNNNFIVDVSEAANVELNSPCQITCKFPQFNATLGGQARIVNDETNKTTLEISQNSNLTLDRDTVRVSELKTGPGSRVDGRGRLAFPSNGRWINEGATINGVSAEEYDVASNDIKIIFEFDASEIRNSFTDGVCRWTSKALDVGTLPFIFSKYDFDAQGRGEYRTIYNSSQPIVDATAPVYETDVDWNGETLKTVVHATPEAGWNFYRVEVSPFANLGGAKIYHGGLTTRYFAVWNAASAPEPTYYYRGGANGSYAATSDWSLTADGVAKFEGAPTSAGAVFIVDRSARLRDFPADSLQTSVVFPAIVDVYDSRNRRLSADEARLVSVGVPTPSELEFYVGKGGTSGFWTKCDGATFYRVEALDGSATGLTTSNRWLDANEMNAKTWRVRVAAPIYGGVEKWSTQTTAVQPFSALIEKPSYDDATAGATFELVYSDNFDGVRDASIVRTGKNDKSSTLLAQNFSGGEFTDAPSSFDEYVYRVAWTPSPENVWLETTAAPWLVADGFDAKTQTNFITTPNRAYETPTFAARIEKKSNGELMKRQDVAKISYSLFETRDHWAARAERLAVGSDGSYWRHNVEIPAATVRDSLLVDPNFWSLDEIGANFVFSPEDGRPFFPGPGAYLVRATLETTNGRRIVVEFPTQVE